MNTFGAQGRFYLKHPKKQTEVLGTRFEELQKEAQRKIDNLEVQLKRSHQDSQNVVDELENVSDNSDPTGRQDDLLVDPSVFRTPLFKLAEGTDQKGKNTPSVFNCAGVWKSASTTSLQVSLESKSVIRSIEG